MAAPLAANDVHFSGITGGSDRANFWRLHHISNARLENCLLQGKLNSLLGYTCNRDLFLLQEMQAVEEGEPWAAPITLRYFQHLATLNTEIVLDRLFRTPQQLLADLNTFLALSRRSSPPA